MFIPVVGGGGLGEYVRCVTLARAYHRQCPDARIRLVVPRDAPPLEDAAIETRVLDRSPTFNSPMIVRWLEEDPPDLAIFDSTARLSQLDAAARVGAKRVHIASRPSRRRRALLIRTLSRVDEVWLVEPGYQRRPLNLWERLNRRLARRAAVVFLDALFPESEPARRATLLGSLGIEEEGYVLLAPGGGGWSVEGKPAAEIFIGVAEQVTEATGLRSVVVTGPLYTGSLAKTDRVIVERSLHPEHMADLMQGAALVAVGGGASLVQALALRKLVVAAPLGGSDQRGRVRRCAELGVLVESNPDRGSLAAAILTLLGGGPRRDELRRRVEALELHNDVERALGRLISLMGQRSLDARLAPTSD